MPTVIGGGAESGGMFSAQQEVNTSAPVDLDDDGVPDDGWMAIADNRGTSPQQLWVYAICTSGTSLGSQITLHPLQQQTRP